MATRMEKYRDKAIKTSRSSRNKNLYNTMYSYDKYSNIEGVASIENANEIDISKVKEMLDSREKVQIERQYRNTPRKEVQDLPVIRSHYKEDVDRNYDIMDVLKTARENKEPDNKERVLNNTNYDILKKLNLKSKSEDDESSKEDDLKELIETIAKTNIIKDSKEETDYDMFSDLTDDDTKVGEIKDITEFIDKNEKTMDDSFFTGGLRLKKADFTVNEKKQSSVLKKIIIAFFTLSILAGIVVMCLYIFNVI